MIFRLLDHFLSKWIISSSKKIPKCNHCKGQNQKQDPSRLFLLPVFHDAEYHVSVQYYLTHCQPIQRTQDIPTGQRACEITTLVCSKCYYRSVLLRDFLQVRDEQVFKVVALYEYSEFQQFLKDTYWHQNSKANSQSTSPKTGQDDTFFMSEF